MDRSNKKYTGLVVIFLAALNVVVSAAVAQDDAPLKVRTYLKPIRSIEVSTTETGLIEELAVKPGDFVKKGDLMIKLNSAVIEAQYAQAKSKAAMTGRLKAAEAEYNLSRDRYNLMLKLRNQGSSNSAETDRGLANMQIAEGNLDAVKEELAFAELEVARIEAELEQRLLRSPITGQVVEVVRDQSENVSMRLENEPYYLVRVVDLSKLRAEAHVPYDRAADLKKGDRLTVVFPHGKGRFEGSIDFISPIVDPATGTVKIHVIFPNKSGQIATGVACDLLIPQP